MRYKRVRISSILLMELFIEGKEYHVKCIKGLPENSKFCYSTPSDHYTLIDLIFEHPSFKELKLGDEIPMFLDPILEKI